MGKLIVNSMIKFTVHFGLLQLAWVVATESKHEVDPVYSDSNYFKMINDFEHTAEDRPSEQRISDRSDAFTLSSDRRSVVECGGVYKRLQSEIRSPSFPNDYQGHLHCEYTFKSPFVCSSQYHFQFVEFTLEPSRNCSKDRLVIGDEEVLCGTVIGSKLYDAPGGLLRMKFITDGWGSGRGFRILVTRQPCTDDNEAAESSTAYSVFTTIQVADEIDTSSEDTATEPPGGDGKIVSSRQDIPPEFNPGENGYLPPPTAPTPTYPSPTYPSQAYPCPAPCPYPQWGCSVPSYPITPVHPPRYPCDPRVQSCSPSYPQYPPYPQQPVPGQPHNPVCPTTPCVPVPYIPQYPQYPSYYPGYPTTVTTDTEGTNSLGGPPPGYGPVKTEVKPEFPEPTTERVTEGVEPENQVSFVPGVGPTCCRNAFNQRRFYLTSANFPSLTTGNQDCVVQVQRTSPYICRLVITFKFFVLGSDHYPGCPGGFVEIDGQRICGCRTGQVYRTAGFGPYPTKTIRIHSRAGRFPTVQGFVLDVYQEECPQRFPLKRSDEYQPQHSSQNGRYSFEMARVEGRQLAVPVQTIQTTNTTQQITHQYYVYNLDDAKPIQRPQDIPLVTGESQQQVVPYRPTATDSQKFVHLPIPTQSGGPNRCLFTTLDWLRLKLDWLWIFKPVCLP
uniref:CUB domain-containing protein n=1 Tax=Anopheles culicifacies TaxID=139723 RepID=A0A182MKS8_9DIPT